MSCGECPKQIVRQIDDKEITYLVRFTKAFVFMKLHKLFKSGMQVIVDKKLPEPLKRTNRMGEMAYLMKRNFEYTLD